MRLFNKRNMIFEHICRSGDRHRHNLAAGFLRDFETAFLKRKHVQFILALAAGAFRVDTHGDAGSDIFDARENSLQAGFDVVAVNKQAVQTAHPCR